jgi:hypothetical protein
LWLLQASWYIFEWSDFEGWKKAPANQRWDMVTFVEPQFHHRAFSINFIPILLKAT